MQKMIVDLRIRSIQKLVFTIWIVVLSSAVAASGAPSEAHLTKIIQDVRLKGSTSPARRALLNDRVVEDTAVLTGAKARAELTFPDQIIVRLGSSTTFRFKDGARSLNLSQGALLLQVPDNAGDVQVHTPSFAAAVTGTTTVFESHAAFYKFLVLTGTARLYRPDRVGDSVLVRAGQLVIGQPNANVSDPVDFDIGRFVQTCPLITDFRPLHSHGLMTADSGKQQHEKSEKVLIDTNLVMFGGGTLVSIVDPAQMDAIGKMKPAPVKKKNKH
jgi:FecR-like protein